VQEEEYSFKFISALEMHGNVSPKASNVISINVFIRRSPFRFDKSNLGELGLYLVGPSTELSKLKLVHPRFLRDAAAAAFFLEDNFGSEIWARFFQPERPPRISRSW
jgi:hypothetical protein